MKRLEEILHLPRRLSPRPEEFASLGELRFLACRSLSVEL